MVIKPARRIEGSINLPGDKSISHRAALIAAIASGSSELSNFSTSLDCASTLSCLKNLGVRIEKKGASVRIEGTSGKLSQPDSPLDCGNSGSTMRMLSGLLAAQNFSSTLTGDASLRSRPMARIIAPLELMGARLSAEEGHAPLRIEGRRPLAAIRYELPVASAQLKSCLLLAGLGAEGRTEVIERVPTRDHTERMLKLFSAPVETTYADEKHVHSIEGPAVLRGRDVKIPGDFSSAAFFIAAAAMLPGSELTIQDVGLNPTRVHLLEVLEGLNLIHQIWDSDECNEPRGSISIRGKSPGQRFSVGGFSINMVAALIDELPLLAVLGSQFNGVSIRDAGELRHKESDRIHSTVVNLRAMGANVEEFQDGMSVAGPVKLHGAALDSFGDHRIAMAFMIAALVAEGESVLKRSECVDISFPGFFERLESVVQR